MTEQETGELQEERKSKNNFLLEIKETGEKGQK